MITMYGTPPVFPPMPDIDPNPGTGLPIDWGRYRVQGPYVAEPTKDPPAPVDQLRHQLETRAAWLENELRMHEAWRLELATIKGMLAAPPAEEPTELPSDRQVKP